MKVATVRMYRKPRAWDEIHEGQKVRVKWHDGFRPGVVSTGPPRTEKGQVVSFGCEVEMDGGKGFCPIRVLDSIRVEKED